MKKSIRIIFLILVVCVFVCGCKKNTKQKQNDKKAEESVAQLTTEEKTEEDENSSVAESVIYVYSYDAKLEENLKLFYNKYPEYKERVEFVNANMDPTDREYQLLIREEMKRKPVKGGESEETDPPVHKYPSIVANDSSMAPFFMQDNYSIPLSSVGISEKDLSEMYPYTLNMARFNGEVKGLTWSVTPGCFLYRADIAQAVLGDSSPDFVQEKIKDWESFKDIAKQMKEAGYKMVPGSDEITYAMFQQKEIPWIDGQTLHIDASAKRCIAFSKMFSKEGYSAGLRRTSKKRKNTFHEDVFGWFVSTEELFAGIPGEVTEGTFRICSGPNAYQWGSTFLTISPDCPDKELAALIVKTLCIETDVLEQMLKKKNVFVNHQTIMEEKFGDNVELNFLDSQNIMPVFGSVMDGIEADFVTPYDGQFVGWLQELSWQYNKEKISSRSEVFEQFKDKVSDQYNYIMIK